MITKEGARRSGARAGGWLWAMRMSEWGIRFLLGAVLAGAELFGGHSLFALALVGASPAGLDGLATLLGAAFGYLSFQGFVEGLRYIAAAMMIYAVFLSLREFRVAHTPWFMPLVSALLNGLVGFVCLSAEGWNLERGIYFATEVVLTAGAVWCYRFAFSLWNERRQGPLNPPQMVGVLALGCTVLMTLIRVEVAGLSAGRVLAALAVLLSAVHGGMGVGAAVGLALGMAVDFAAGGAPYYAMVCGFGGLMAGIFAKEGRLFAALAYLVSAGAAALWTWSAQRGLIPLWEAAAGAAIYLVLPNKLLRRLSALFRQEGPKDEGTRGRGYAARRLSRSAAAFRAVAGGLDGLFDPLPPNDGDAAKLFERAAAQVCQRCGSQEICWHREYQSTRAALNDALPRLLDQGVGTEEDFPDYFVQRCGEFARFLAACNRELEHLLLRRRYDSRVRESRAAVCAQYTQLAGMLERAAGELAVEFAVDVPAQRRIKQRMGALGIEGRCAVYYDEHRRLRIELEGQGVEQLAASDELDKLEKITCQPLRVEREEAGRVELLQREPFLAVAGVAAAGKDGAPVSGDVGAWFKDEAGRLYVLLCDGMGSGPAAHTDSDSALRLLEKFLRAGLSPRQAMRTVGDALALKGEEQGGFTTVDLLQLDLYTGQGAVYKLGAAPTYLRRAGDVERFATLSLPAGLAGQGAEEPDRFPLELQVGDCLVMVSDGVSSGREDSWLTDTLTQFDGLSPQELAKKLLEDSADQEEGTDDRTVLVIKIQERGR